MSFVSERFTLSQSTKDEIQALTPNFGFDGFGYVVYKRTYSRTKPDGGQEEWGDTVIRVTEGIMSIRKDHLLKNCLIWNEDYYQQYARDFAISFFHMEFLPPGRGLWATGASFMYEKGSAACNNCGACTMKDLLVGTTWMMDFLMLGVGVGCDTSWKGEAIRPNKDISDVHIIPDSREGWVGSVNRLISSYVAGTPFPIFDYSQIRPKGSPLKGFGGTASGPDPLVKLHRRIEIYLDTYLEYQEGGSSPDVFEKLVRRLKDVDYEPYEGESQENFEQRFEQLIDQVRQSAMRYPNEKRYDATRCQIDIVNAIGSCVVSGNIRRSSEIVLGEPGDLTFLNLKNYTINPERQLIGWMSNNSVRLSKTEDFRQIPNIAERIRDNGEPGILNQLNIKRFGRVNHRHDDADPWTRELEEDLAHLCNPCSEIPLEPYELCNICDIFPTRCMKKNEREVDEEKYFKAVQHATFYCTTMSLLPTHNQLTNVVIARNRRIGVGLSGIADLYDLIGFTELTRLCRMGYKIIRTTNTSLAKEAGVPPSIRVTTIKPSGSISLLAGISPGMHFPTFKYAIRRMRISETSPLIPLLIKAGYHHEKDIYSDHTIVFEFPIDQGKTRPAEDVSLWEQLSLLAMLQREHSDNMCSVTIYFNKEKEGDQLEQALAIFAPAIKSCSMLPHSPVGAYVQAPYEKIDRERYLEIKLKLKPIDWGTFNGSDGILPRFCNNDTCEFHQ